MKKFLLLGTLALSFTSFANQSELERLEKVDFADYCTVTICRNVNGTAHYTTHKVKLEGGMTCQQAVDWLNERLSLVTPYPSSPFVQDLYKYSDQITEVKSVKNILDMETLFYKTR